MFQKINHREKIVGWYSSGPKIRPHDIEINEVFRKYCPNPVFVIINVLINTTTIIITAYGIISLMILFIFPPHNKFSNPCINEGTPFVNSSFITFDIFAIRDDE